MANNRDEYGMCPPVRVVIVVIGILFGFAVWIWQSNDTTDRAQDVIINENKTSVKLVVNELKNINTTLNRILDRHELVPKKKGK